VQIITITGLENKRVREFQEEELTVLREEVDKYLIEGDLRRFNMMNIKRLKEIQVSTLNPQPSFRDSLSHSVP
jgi:small subunit ribosomal protein S13